jgi:BASS family bile acid:Na+ symporter
MLFLMVAIAGIISRERANLVPLLVDAGPPAILLNCVTMGLGLLVARLARLAPKQVITITIEVGIQNAILATALAVAPQFLGRTDIGLVPTIYGFTMVVIMLLFVGLLRVLPGILGNHEATVKQ